MSDELSLGVITLLFMSAIGIGFVVGWNANPSDDHDPRDEGDLY